MNKFKGPPTGAEVIIVILLIIFVIGCIVVAITNPGLVVGL